jgi:hypothetical protein
MKNLLQQLALAATITFATPAVATEDLQGQLLAIRHAMQTLNSTSSAVAALEANILKLRSYHYTHDVSALPAQTPMPRGQIGIIPASLALVHLKSISSRSVDQALPAISNALVIRAGRLTLTQLVEDVAKQVPGAVLHGAHGPIFQMPIFIWTDAELVLEKDDHLVLSARSNSFILNAGVLRMQRAKLSVEAGDAASAFRPFVTTVLGGAFQAEDSTFSDLGFSGTAGAEGVTISNSALSLKKAETILSGNYFENIGSLSFRHVANLKIQHNRFFGLRFSNIQFEDATKADVSNNLFLESSGRDAIHVGSGSSDITITNNAILSGNGDGIRVGQGTSHITILGNVVAGQNRDAIAVDRSSCVAARGNIIFKNNGNGINISRSSNVVLSTNRFIQNSDAGVLVRLQQKDAITVLEKNQFIENATGVRGQAASQLEIFGNDLSEQLPIMVAGDFTESIKAFLDMSPVITRKHLDASSWATSNDDVGLLALKQPVLPCQNGS